MAFTNFSPAPVRSRRQANKVVPTLPTSKSTYHLRDIQRLNDFGFSTNSALIPLSSERRIDGTVHVTDLWSLRLKRQFLRETGLSAAQHTLQRHQVREILLAHRSKVEDSHTADELYNRILAEDNPMEAVKIYASGKKGKLLKQLTNQLRVNSTHPAHMHILKFSTSHVLSTKQTSSLHRLEEIVHRCEASLSHSLSWRQ